MSAATIGSSGSTYDPSVSRTAPVGTITTAQRPQRGQATAIGSGTSCAERRQTTANGRPQRVAWQKCRIAQVSSIPPQDTAIAVPKGGTGPCESQNSMGCKRFGPLTITAAASDERPRSG